MLRVHVLQHMPHEGLGSIADWLTAVGADVSFTHFFAAYKLPDLANIDMVIALGGPMSVNDEVTLPWLVAEKAFLRDAITQGKAVLGICLGAQLIASALGARVSANACKEIGWFPVTAVTDHEAVFCFPPVIDVFHWHGETFGLPSGAVHLARSAACEHQAFQIGRKVIGLQFHLETDVASATAFVDADNNEPEAHRELVPAATIQSAEHILATPMNAYGQINALMVRVLEYLAEGV